MTLEERIERLEAESEIRQLIAHYSFDIDDRLIESIRNLFTDDGVLKSRDGVMFAKGPDAIIEQYHGRFDVLGPGHHFMHDVQINFVEGSAVEATGRVSGHAELVRKGQMMVAALRYADCYTKTDVGWKFAEREISFLYYVPVEDYPNILLNPARNRAYGEPAPADFPENLVSWIEYHESRGSGC
jgi:ketosteroid isomerase-like protein